MFVMFNFKINNCMGVVYIHMCTPCRTTRLFLSGLCCLWGQTATSSIRTTTKWVSSQQLVCVVLVCMLVCVCVHMWGGGGGGKCGCVRSCGGGGGGGECGCVHYNTSLSERNWCGPVKNWRSVVVFQHLVWALGDHVLCQWYLTILFT